MLQMWWQGDITPLCAPPKTKNSHSSVRRMRSRQKTPKTLQQTRLPDLKKVRSRKKHYTALHYPYASFDLSWRANINVMRRMKIGVAQIFSTLVSSLNLIIDNGSGMNVVVQEVIDKLKFPVEKHPKPYKLSLVDDTSILVKHRCLI